MNRTGLKTLVVLTALAGGVALGVPGAEARVNVGIGIGLPGVVVAPPVVAAPYAYYGAPAYYAPPAYYYPPAVAPGYWWYDRFGHRYWRRR